MAPMYYRGASAALLVYDITHKSTFESMKEWVKGLSMVLERSAIQCWLE
tara:strand:+ start:430 stop:576 length:147 start_codon:yes stop_codon:yes gene_type:complete